MTRKRTQGFDWDIRPVVESMGLDEVIRQIGKDEVIRQIGAKQILTRLGTEEFLADLPASKRRELKRLLTKETDL